MVIHRANTNPFQSKILAFLRFNKDFMIPVLATFKISFLYQKQQSRPCLSLLSFQNYSLILCLLSGLPAPYISNILWIFCGCMAISGPMIAIITAQ